MTQKDVKRSRGRRAAEIHGRHAETLCAWLLRCKFYRILARQWRGVGGELDVVARRGKTLVFVEVKARDRVISAAEALNRTQRRRISTAARQFIAAHPAYSAWDSRYDVMLVVPRRLPIHLKGAWVEGD